MDSPTWLWLANLVRLCLSIDGPGPASPGMYAGGRGASGAAVYLGGAGVGDAFADRSAVGALTMGSAVREASSVLSGMGSVAASRYAGSGSVCAGTR